MKGRRSRWVSAIGAVLVSGALLVAGYGSGVTPSAAALPASNPGDPFSVIMAKLDQILAAITGGAGAGNHTLRWDSNNLSASRFTTAFPGAVLDHNTGLVWEQAPDTTGGPNSDGLRIWFDSISYCANKNVGGTRGWRLPSVIELASLIDPSLGDPYVPASIFTGVRSALYWSATPPLADNPTIGWTVFFFNGGFVNNDFRGRALNAWCVRGGMNADAY